MSLGVSDNETPYEHLNIANTNGDLLFGWGFKKTCHFEEYVSLALLMMIVKSAAGSFDNALESDPIMSFARLDPCESLLFLFVYPSNWLKRDCMVV